MNGTAYSLRTANLWYASSFPQIGLAGKTGKKAKEHVSSLRNDRTLTRRLRFFVLIKESRPKRTRMGQTFNAMASLK